MQRTEPTLQDLAAGAVERVILQQAFGSLASVGSQEGPLRPARDFTGLAAYTHHSTKHNEPQGWAIARAVSLAYGGSSQEETSFTQRTLLKGLCD